MTTERYRYLLDTAVVSEVVRNPQGPITRRIARVGETRVCTSIVVACELRYGAAKRGSARLCAQLEQVFAVLPILPLELGVDGHYGDIRADLERKGTPIGANDLLIAAQARYKCPFFSRRSQTVIATVRANTSEGVSELSVRRGRPLSSAATLPGTMEREVTRTSFAVPTFDLPVTSFTQV